MPEPDYLKLILMVFIAGGGAGKASRSLCESWAWFQTKTPKVKVVVAVGVSSLFSMIAYAAMVAMLYQAAPIGWRGWIGSLVGAAVVGSGFADTLHKMIKRFGA